MQKPRIRSWETLYEGLSSLGGCARVHPSLEKKKAFCDNRKHGALGLAIDEPTHLRSSC